MGGVAVCGLCATRHAGVGECPACGSHSHFVVRSSVDGEWVEELPAGFPCPGCGRVDQPLVFRGWSRLGSFLLWCWERRAGGYLCPNCALIESSKSLLFTALLGWLSLPSVLFFAWRSTYHNWRSVFAAPSKPLAWGALGGEELAEILAAILSDGPDGFGEPGPGDVSGTPLEGLSHGELVAVMNAEGLYELIGADPSASREEIRRAYRQAAMRAHPDLAGEQADGEHDLMVRINQAWEILGDERLRAAYDWLQEQGR